MMDEQLLDTVPEYLSIDLMFKAMPLQEGNGRFIYIEASNEGRDQQGEIVLAKALSDSVDHFLKFGNIDLDHNSMPTIATMKGITDPEYWEIGSPVAVKADGNSTFVKAELFSGDTKLAERANMVWDSMTKLNPPKKWYASVGGTPLAKAIKIDPATGDKVPVISKVRWTNLALTQHPVNQHVSGVSTSPFGVLAKSYGLVYKALEASYATDAAAKTGGAALGVQSLDTGIHSYFDFREKLAGAIRSGTVKTQSMNGLIAYATKNFHLPIDEATEWVDRFLNDLKSSLTRKSSQSKRSK